LGTLKRHSIEIEPEANDKQSACTPQAAAFDDLSLLRVTNG